MLMVIHFNFDTAKRILFICIHICQGFDIKSMNEIVCRLNTETKIFTLLPNYYTEALISPCEALGVY